MQRPKKNTLIASACGLIIGLVIAITAQTQANLPLADSQGKHLPSLAPMLERINPAVVNISVTQTQKSAQNPLLNDPFFRQFFNVPDNFQQPQRQAKSAGSGVIADAKKGIVITNHHVVKNATEIMVGLSDGRNIKATLIGSDPEVDIAILKITPKNLTSIPWANSEKIRVGDFSVAIGNPFGLGQTVTTGIVSAIGRSGLGIQGYENFIQTDASINPGNSGGALVNLRGELIGINTAIIAPNGGNVGIGFAIPTNMAKYSMEQILKHGKVSRGQLGIFIQDLNPELAKMLGANAQQQGVLISKVQAGSPAQRAGIKEGDIVVQIDKRSIKTAAQLRNAIGIKRPGQTIAVEVLRNGRKQAINVAISEGVFASKPTAQKTPPTRVSKSIIEGASLEEARSGVRVTQVQRGSIAANSGLRQGDLILGANKRRIKNKKELAYALQQTTRNALLQIQRANNNLFLILRRR